MQNKNYDSRSGVVSRGHQRMERRDEKGTTGNFGGDDTFSVLIVVMDTYVCQNYHITHRT